MFTSSLKFHFYKYLLHGFDLDDVVTYRAKESLIPQYKLETKFDTDLLEDIVLKQSENLKNYASDILNGDMSIFPELDKLVKERAKHAAFQKWGDKAEEFGWKKIN